MKGGYKLVYFLGAGAAKPCGYLTTPELYNALIGERPELALFKQFGEVIDKMGKGKPWDIETLYTLVTSDLGPEFKHAYDSIDSKTFAGQLLLEHIHKHDLWSQRIHQAEAAFREAAEAIFQFIIEKFWKVEANLKQYEKLRIGSSCSKLGYENVTVFTTNYDMSLEKSLSGFVPYTTGIENDEFYPQVLLPEDPERLRIVKLHGSLDLFELDDGKIVRINYPAHPGAWIGGRTIRRPYLVPPSEGKTTYDSQQEGLIELFKQTISEADAMAIIGSSLRDTRLAEALSNARKDCHILVACGSQSESIAVKWFLTQSDVTPVHEGFPNSMVENWLVIHSHLKGEYPDSKENIGFRSVNEAHSRSGKNSHRRQGNE